MKNFLIVVALLLAVSAPVMAKGRLPFIEDDSSRALSEANRRKLPVFVEVWAPW